LPSHPFPSTILDAIYTAAGAEGKERNMAKVKQLTISLANRPGALAQMARVLADAKVNLLALLGNTTGPQGSAQVVVDDIRKAKKALEQALLLYSEGTVEEFELANKPGALAEVAGKLANKGINIDSAYATMPKGAKKAVLLVATSQQSGS
jgi:hypothetical protein